MPIKKIVEALEYRGVGSCGTDQSGKGRVVAVAFEQCLDRPLGMPGDELVLRYDRRVEVGPALNDMGEVSLGVEPAKHGEDGPVRKRDSRFPLIRSVASTPLTPGWRQTVAIICASRGPSRSAGWVLFLLAKSHVLPQLRS